MLPHIPKAFPAAIGLMLVGWILSILGPLSFGIAVLAIAALAVSSVLIVLSA